MLSIINLEKTTYLKFVQSFFYFLSYKKCNFYTKSQLFYFPNFVFYSYYLKTLKTLKNFIFKNNLKFTWFKFVLFLGLGFKKKLNWRKKLMHIYIGDRHWLVVPLPKSILLFPFKRRNLVFFGDSKTKVFYFNNLLKELKKQSIFKLKGFVDARTKRRWLFVRRIKIRGLRTKLSKKQKLI